MSKQRTLPEAAVLLADTLLEILHTAKLGNGVLLREREVLTLDGLAREVRGAAVRQGVGFVEGP